MINEFSEYWENGFKRFPQILYIKWEKNVGNSKIINIKTDINQIDRYCKIAI